MGSSVKESFLQPAAQSESEQTSSDEYIDPGDEEKLEEELIFNKIDLLSPFLSVEVVHPFPCHINTD